MRARARPARPVTTFANPGRPLTPPILRLTGIRDDELLNAPSPREAVALFSEFAFRDGAPCFVGHNVGFDVSFLVFLIPDILCNAGGVTVSYFEWVQDVQNLFWREATINARLKEVMVKSFNDVLETSKKHKVDMRTAAYMVAVGRVAEATLTRGIDP